jgi:hypothetical protein
MRLFGTQSAMERPVHSSSECTRSKLLTAIEDRSICAAPSNAEASAKILKSAAAAMGAGHRNGQIKGVRTLNLPSQ